MDMQIAAWLAAALVFASFFMKTIVPLRSLAIVSNLVFICYALLGVHHGIFDKVLPILVLHLALMPLNITRLSEVRVTIRSIRAKQAQSKPHDFLIPYMTRSTVAASTLLLKRGDHADTVFLPDINKRLVAGAMLGEIAIFSDHATRSTTAVWEKKCELLRIQREKVLELFYQDKTFAFQIARALSNYVVENTDMVADTRAEVWSSARAELA